MLYNNKWLIIYLLLSGLSSATVLANTDKKQQENLTIIHLSGASKDLQENIKVALPSRKPVCNADQDELDDFLTSLEKTLQKAARGVGYYQSRFQANATQQNGCWQIAININEGQRIKVRQVDVKMLGEGRNEADLQNILATPMYQIGDVLTQSIYNDYKTNLIDTATSLGYLDATFTEHSITINPDRYTADIKLHLDTGKRYRYGKITTKQDVLDQAHLDRYIQLKEGNFYSSEALSEQQLFLQTTGYYADVIIKTDISKAQNGKVPVKIDLLPQKRNVYTYSIGYGTDTGVRGSASMERRWVNKKGHKLDAELLASETLSYLGAEYTVPLQHPKDEYLAYHASAYKEVGEDIESETLEAGVKYTHKAQNGALQSVFLDYIDDATQITGEDKVETEYLLLGAHVEKTKRDHPIFPTKGYKVELELQGGHEKIASTQNILSGKLAIKHLQPLSKGRFLSRLDIGHVATDNFELLPMDMRFFAGGRNTVRGYDFESLGEFNDNGYNIGAKNLLAVSLEYNHPIKDKWSAAAFVDAGNAFNDWGDTDNLLQYGIGVGARWKSPIGPVKVDVAWPTDNLGDPHLHLSIGPEL
jgi:translocation and assembly module TamA